MEDGLVEQAEEAELEGDMPYRPGTVRAALSHRTFRRLWLGAFASNVGTWMQNVALGVFAYDISHSAAYVAALGFAQLGPSFLLAMLGGALGDAADRRRLLLIWQTEQMVMSGVLAWAASVGRPSELAVFLCVLAVGVGNALNNPVFAALLPALVGRRDMPGAVSLQSVQMNLSRVIGPAIGGLLFPAIHAWGIFALNAATYLFAIFAIASVTLPPPPGRTGSERTMRRLAAGMSVARRTPVVRRTLLTVAAISFFSLPFIGLMPVVAARDLHMSPNGATYGGLYALFGLGAAGGAVSVGSVLVDRSRPALIRAGLVSFAVCLAGFAFCRSAAAGYVVAPVLGYCYFVTITALSTGLQEALDDEVRGRVTALWIMGFGGTVPLGLIAAGPVVDATSVTTVLLLGAVAALVVAACWFLMLVRPAAAPTTAS